MKTRIITLFTLLIVSLSQVMGQTLRTPVPPAPGAQRIFLENFGTPPMHTTPGTHTPGFTAYGLNNVSWYNASITSFTNKVNQLSGFVGDYSGSNADGANPGNGHYTVATTTKNSPYGPWWGSDGHPQQPYYDHTYDHTGQTVTQANNHPEQIPGFMMVINASTKGDKFFEYPIKNLCPNTHLIFRVYVGNLCAAQSKAGYNPNDYADPILQFEVDDGATGNFLTSSVPTVIPKTSSPVWQPVSFEFNTGSANSVILKITDIVTTGMGNDLVLDDIEVWLVPPIAAIISPNSQCGIPEPLVATYNSDYVASTFGLANCDIEWVFSTDSTLPITSWHWLKGGLLSDPYDLTCDANLATPFGGPEGFYRTIIGNMTDYTQILAADLKCEGISDPFQYTIAPVDATLFWSLNPENQNWNNPKNWLDQNGTAVNYAPSRCTDVHIPGNAPFYPSLDIATSGYHSSCRNIWFHFGGQIGRPHLLEYDSAYVQYDFGMSDGLSHDYGYGYKGGDNTPFLAAKPQLYSTGTPMARGRWYALAAPLQKIASGDFANGGYPKTWQQGFKSSSVQKSGTNSTLDAANWYAPVNTDDWDVGQQYNAIAIWAGEVSGSNLASLGEGTGFQTNLDGLKGIIEMPYFENSAMKSFHTEFKHEGGTSYFPYFYNRLNTPGVKSSGFVFTGDYGTMDRGKEAYKFIFRGPKFTSENVNGDSIYTMDVSKSVNTEIMVGNPFFSQLDFNAFALSNGITEYRLYEGTNFVGYSTTAGGGAADIGGADQFIAPLQAFFIKPVSASLKFNADSVAVADPNDNKLRSASTSGSNMKADVLYLKAESHAGKSYLTLSMQEADDKNLILLLPDGYPEVPQIYATDETGQRNVIQFEGGYVTGVPLGVLSTDSAMVTLTVQNAENMAVDSLILWDQYLNIKVDLKTVDTYTFKNVPSVSDRFVLIPTNKSMTGFTKPQVVGSVRANVIGNTLYVSAASGIADVSVISLGGITLSKDVNIGQNTYSKALNLPTGVYLVSVKLVSGETKVVKVVSNK